jgi:redox-sensing transcriptional repressor
MAAYSGRTAGGLGAIILGALEAEASDDSGLSPWLNALIAVGKSGVRFPPPHFENAVTRSVPCAVPPGARRAFGRTRSVTATPRRRIPEATVARLPLYYRALLETGERQVATISSERLAELAGVNAAKVRKDLSYLGSYGTRGVGYDVDYLLHEISRELGLTRDWPVAIVGIGNLGRALANYKGFGARGFRVVALIDADPALVGKVIGDLAVESIDDLGRIVTERGIAIGILATPAGAAQDVADRLVDAGVTSILNFAPAVCTVPEGVSMRKVDLAIELQILSFYQLRRGAPSGPAREQAG